MSNLLRPAASRLAATLAAPAAGALSTAASGPPQAGFDPASLKILHILRAPLGGLFRHVLDVAHGQCQRGHRVGLIVDSTTGGARAEAILADLAPSLELGLERTAIARELGPSDLPALRLISRRVKLLAPERVARPRRQGRRIGTAGAERATRHPRLYATRRLARLPARHVHRQLLSLPGVSAEVAHRPLPVRKQLCRQPVPHADGPAAGDGARRPQRRRRCRVRAGCASCRCRGHRLRR